MTATPEFGFDTWWHLASGRWMVQHLELLDIDVFSHTQYGAPWVRPGLLADVLLYMVHELGGLAALQLLVVAAVVGPIWGSWRLLSCPPVWRSVICVTAGLATIVAATPRPLVFSLGLTVLTLHLLHRARKGARTHVVGLPVVIVLWVNLHGTYVIGLALIAAELVGGIVDRYIRGRDRPLRALGLVAVGSTAAALLNPFGWQILAYPIETMRLGVLRDMIEEWQPVEPLSMAGALLAVILVTASVSLLILRRQLSFADVLSITGFGLLALTARRHMPYVALVAGPVVAAAIAREDRPTERKTQDMSTAVPLVAAALGLAATAFGFWYGTRAVVTNEAVRHRIPVEAVAAIPSHGRLFNAYDWGGYLIWARPDVPTYVDGRTDLFGDRLVREWSATYRAHPGWQEAFTRHEIDVALIQADSPLARQLADRGWRRLFDDGRAAVFTAPTAVARGQDAGPAAVAPRASRQRPRAFVRWLPSEVAT